MKKFFNEILVHPITIIIISALVVSAIAGLRTRLKSLELSEQNIKLEQEEGQRLTSELHALDSQIERSSQPLAKERLIRNELVQQIEGEIVLKLPDVQISQDIQHDQTELSNWEKWMELIF
ncbi:MAG: hypothetical protein XD95_0100 [Microgenomates bacterium 39_7]|nr:MAG: hypothetical protein XD95_0100 [Microgenomates bacterium 39_7]